MVSTDETRARTVHRPPRSCFVVQKRIYANAALSRGRSDQTTSKRSRFMTLFHAATKS